MDQKESEKHQDDIRTNLTDLDLFEKIASNLGRRTRSKVLRALADHNIQGFEASEDTMLKMWLHFANAKGNYKWRSNGPYSQFGPKSFELVSLYLTGIGYDLNQEKQAALYEQRSQISKTVRREGVIYLEDYRHRRYGR